MHPSVHLPICTAMSLALLALLPAGTASAAQTQIETQLGTCCAKRVTNPTADVIETLTKTSLQGGTAVASVFGSVSGGVLKAKVESASAGLKAPSNAATSNAKILDLITVSNAALTGQAGFAHIVLDYDLALGVEGTSAFADVAVRMFWRGARVEVLWQGSSTCQSLTDCTLFDSRKASWAPNSSTQSSPLVFGQPIGIDIPIVFGRADDFELSLMMDASSGQRFGEGLSSAFVDGAHSVYWGGIASVTDSLGNPVQALVSSESGIDYQRSYLPSAVPEPGVAALWAAGLAGLYRIRRRHRAGEC